MTRFSITMNEALDFILKATEFGQGSEIFLPKIKSYTIKTIKESLIEILGNFEENIIGIRPGEKLFEELLIGNNISKTDHPMIMRAEEDEIEWKDLKEILKDLKEASINSDFRRVREILTIAVPDFKPQSQIEDFLFKET